MDKNELISMWREYHADNQVERKINFNSIGGVNHCKIMAKIISDQKLKIVLYSTLFAVYICLMLFAFVYLRLALSIISVIPLVSAGLFILINTTLEISRFRVLNKTADTRSIKDSTLIFRQKIQRIGRFDLAVYLVTFYLLAAGTTLLFINDIGGIKNLSMRNDIFPSLLVLILMLLLTPWFIKYQHYQRYKGLFSSLDDSLNDLSDAPSSHSKLSDV